MTDIRPGNDTAAWLRVLANQIEANDAPDFFLVTAEGDGNVDYTWRTLANALELVGAVEIKLFEMKDEIIKTKTVRR